MKVWSRNLPIWLGLCLPLLLIASAVWACTAQPTVHGLSFQGPPGTVVQLQGASFGEVAAPVEIRWNGSGGEVLAKATPDATGSFSVAVTIPQAPPGVHFLTADGQGFMARTAFEVLPGSSNPVPAAAADGGLDGLWHGFSGVSVTNDTAPSSEAQPEVLNAGTTRAIGSGLVGVSALLMLGAVVAMRSRRRAVRVHGPRS